MSKKLRFWFWQCVFDVLLWLDLPTGRAVIGMSDATDWGPPEDSAPTEDPDREATGYKTLRRFAEHLGTVRQRFDFDAEHRAEYERRKAAGGER